MNDRFSYRKDVMIRTLDYTEEFCTTCDRVTMFDIQTNQCIVCGSDNPFGLWGDHTDKEWDEYYSHKEMAKYCPLIKQQKY